MGNLRGRVLEEEFCNIAVELGGDAEGKARGDAYLSAAHPVANRDGSSTWALTPKVFGTAEVEILKDAAETMGRIVEKVTERYLKDADLRALFGLPADQEELALMPTGYEQLIPFARFDVLFDQQTGDFTFAGVATTTAGMTAAVDVTRAVQLTEAYRRFAERHHGIETFDITGEVVRDLRETYASWANADAGTHHPERPVVGIVDFPESSNAGEFADLIERLSDEGVFARFVNIRDLRIEEAGGVRRLVDGVGPITCVYRRAPLAEMLDKRCEGSDALIEAARRGLACIIGGFRAWPVATNAIFSVLHSEAMESILDPQELAFVRAHVPEAHVLEHGADVTRYLAEQNDWLVRPAGGYRVSEAVAGVDRMDRDEWWRVLLACSEEHGVVERCLPAYRSEVVVGGAEAKGANPAEPVEVNNLLGLFLCRGKFSGIYARCGYESVMGSWGHRLDMGCLVVSD
ncbi:hypothetical protein [Olsenella profusa]|uniref:Circularly permuted type 2 ATP-grasp protein n=1 Tax=Olsenella profusa TaxID=138595 RepID=A0ABS2F3D1_9ACTN|nr:hypothetical protein [Olsenella profusa]MBM6775315.1 hypothetical protein [Olsenella profusa]